MTQNHQSSCHLNETELNIRNIGDRSTICTNRLRTSVEHHQTENKKQHHQTEHQSENQDSIPQHIYKDMYTCVYIYVRIARRRAIYHILMEETTAKRPAHTCAREFQNRSQTTNPTQTREQKTTAKASPKTNHNLRPARGPGVAVQNMASQTRSPKQWPFSGRKFWPTGVRPDSWASPPLAKIGGQKTAPKK